MSYYEYHVSRRYVQFPGAIRELPRYVASIGKKLLILIGSIPEIVEPQIEAAMEASCREQLNDAVRASSSRYAAFYQTAEHFDLLRKGMAYELYEIIDWIPSARNIQKIADHVKSGGFDTVVGIGGGRTMDIARGITRFTPAHVILVPTLAATNATISTLSVIYSDDGSVIEDYWRMDNAPDLTLVDTDILLRNSPQALTAGIADITCTYLEGLCNLELGNIRSEYPVFSYEGLQLALQIMHRCAPGAIQAVRNGQLNPDFENILSMIMHNCGPLWTACSMGLAHALDEVLLYFPQTHKQPHGLRVGFASIPMLAFAGKRADQISHYTDFCTRLGIPTTLRDFGLEDVSPALWKAAAEQTIGRRHTLEQLPYKVTFEEVLPYLLAYSGS